MPPKQDRSFSGGLGWNGHLDLCRVLDFCGGLVYRLSGGNLELLGLDDGSGGPDSSSGDGQRDVREADGRVLRLYNFSIKVFDTVL